MVGVFISYARADIDFASRIKAELDARGADAFIEYQRLQRGNFQKQLGIAIESREFFIIILSPRSVDREWVQAELAYAVMKKRTIVPILLESCEVTSVFFVTRLQWVDFTLNNPYGGFEGAMRKLAEYLNLPLDSITPVIAADPPAVEPEPDHAPDDVPTLDSISAESMFAYLEEATDEPTALSLQGEFNFLEDALHVFGEDEIDDLFASAVEMGDSDPEQSVYLLHRVLEIAPDYLGGKAQRMIEKIEPPLNKRRSEILFSRAQAFFKTNEYIQAIASAEQAHTLDPALDVTDFLVECQIARAEHAFTHELWEVGAEASRFLCTYLSVKIAPQVYERLNQVLTIAINKGLDNPAAVIALIPQISDAPTFKNLAWYDTLNAAVIAPNYDGNVPDAYGSWETAFLRAELGDMFRKMKTDQSEIAWLADPAPINRYIVRMARARAHLEKREWAAAAVAAKDALQYLGDYDSTERRAANRVIEIAEKNPPCDVLYEKAARASRKGQYRTAKLLVDLIMEDCPDYGDLSHLWSDTTPSPQLISVGDWIDELGKQEVSTLVLPDDFFDFGLSAADDVERIGTPWMLEVIYSSEEEVAHEPESAEPVDMSWAEDLFAEEPAPEPEPADDTDLSDWLMDLPPYHPADDQPR